jgi:hypothetical protein
MTIKEAISVRHVVRKYVDKPIPAEILEKLNARIAENNSGYGLEMKLKIDDDKAFNAIIKMILAKGVRNYLILAASETPDAEVKLGYSGIDVALYAQTLGLNSWWVGSTFSRGAMEKESGSRMVAGVIVIGYGATQGVPHKSKTAAMVSMYQGQAPVWFQEGVQAALLAPTAMNRQRFMINGKDNHVSMECNNGTYSDVDLGILKYHFEVGAGRDNFVWE